VGDILVGDTIINIDPNTMEVSSTLVNSIKVADSVEVYDIRTAPYQWYIVEDNIAIS
jgi:phosphotransacetylase